MPTNTQAVDSAAGRVMRQPGRQVDLWFDGKRSFPMKKTVISGKDAEQMWPSDDTEGQTLPEALTHVTHLGKIQFVQTLHNLVLSSMSSSAHLHVLLERFGSGRERQSFRHKTPSPESNACTGSGRLSLISPNNTSIDSITVQDPLD